MEETSVGRLIFKDQVNIDEEIIDRIFDRIGMGGIGKKEMGLLVAEICRRFGAHQTAGILDQIKRIGFQFATQSGNTIAMHDIVIPEAKGNYRRSGETSGTGRATVPARLITQEERYQRYIDIWTKAKDDTSDAMLKSLDIFNPVYMMATSGARGNVSQLSQLAGMRGLMTDPPGASLTCRLRPISGKALRCWSFPFHPRRPKGFGRHRFTYRRFRLSNPASGRCGPGCDCP